MPDVHALLSASSSKQWLHCTPSARLQEQFPNESSVYAAEGTFAHEVCEYKVRKYLKERVKRPQSEEYYTEEIDQITDVYAEFVIGVIEEMKRNGCEPLVMVEEKVNYSHIAPSGFGTADMLIIGKDENGKGVLHIADFKTGQGVFVDADHKIVRMSIIQPRLENISTFECSRSELEDWGESIRETAKLAYEGKGEQKPGDWCRFCRAKPVCKACKDEALSLCREEFFDLDDGALSDNTSSSPEQGENAEPVFKQPGLVPISELAQLLPTLNRISSWIEAVFAFINSEAINHGVPIPGYKVVEGRSKRVFTDTKAVVETAVANGYTDLYKQQLITLTEFETMMGKKKFAELLGKYVTKPPGKLSLVPESDPREPVVLNNSPNQEFAVLPDDGE